MIRFVKGKQPFGVAILNLKTFQFVAWRLKLRHPPSKWHPSIPWLLWGQCQATSDMVCVLAACSKSLPSHLGGHGMGGSGSPSPHCCAALGHHASRCTCSKPSARASNWEAKRLFLTLYCLESYWQNMPQIGLVALVTVVSMLLFYRDHQDLWGLQDQM